MEFCLALFHSTGDPGAYPMGGLVYVITSADLGLLGAISLRLHFAPDRKLTNNMGNYPIKILQSCMCS